MWANQQRKHLRPLKIYDENFPENPASKWQNKHRKSLLNQGWKTNSGHISEVILWQIVLFASRDSDSTKQEKKIENYKLNMTKFFIMFRVLDKIYEKKKRKMKILTLFILN